MTPLAEQLRQRWRREIEYKESPEERGSRHEIVLVGCCATKLDRRARARDIYVSQLYQLHQRFALLRYGFVSWILSAKHGLLDTLEEIDPYETKLPGGYRARAEWSAKILGGLVSRVAARGSIIVLAGSSYYDGWAPYARELGWRVETPFAGLDIGKRKQALKRACDAIEAEHVKVRTTLAAAGMTVEERGSDEYGTRFVQVFWGEEATVVCDGTVDSINRAVRACEELAA